MKKIENSVYLSYEARWMMVKDVGFRNDSCYNSGVNNVFDIIDFEVFELGNNDILRTCKNLYGLKMDLRKRKESVEIVKQFLYNLYSTKELKGLWLAIPESVMKLYDGKLGMGKYKLPSDALIISDLGFDGCLFVSKIGFELKGEY